jgi:RND family efflux transporter MFP subunit
MKRRIVAITLFVSLLFALIGCKDKVKPGKAETKRQEVSGVKVTAVQPSVIAEYYEVSGTVRSKRVNPIVSRVMGTVTSLNVREGDLVKAGQVLITIDDKDITQKVIAAESGYRESLKALEAAGQNKSLADITYQRYRKLHEEKVITQQEMDQIETQKKVADIEYERIQEMVNRTRAGLSEAKVMHEFTKIIAPASGTVVEKKIEPGSMAIPGTPLLTIEDTSSFRVEVPVDESLSGKLRVGMQADIVIESLNQKLEGKISEIVPAIDPMTRTILVKIDVTGTGLKSGLYARVRIPVGKREAIMLPMKAIVERGQLSGVYAVDGGGVITFRILRLGKEHNGSVEVLSGLRVNERVITEGMEKASDGGILREVKGK